MSDSFRCDAIASPSLLMEHLDRKGCYKVEIILLALLFNFHPRGKWMEGGLESSSSRVESGVESFLNLALS